MEKLTMSRPSDLSFFAFSATAMMALGRARPMRFASWGIAFLADDEGAEKPHKDSTHPCPARARRSDAAHGSGMLAREVSPMPFVRRVRLLSLWLLLAAGGAVAAVGERGTLAIVAPDVEIVADRADASGLPSATASEAVAGQWLSAVASTLERAGPMPVWTPPPRLDDG